jgi:hypothetical protein
MQHKSRPRAAFYFQKDEPNYWICAGCATGAAMTEAGEFAGTFEGTADAPLASWFLTAK